MATGVKHQTKIDIQSNRHKAEAFVLVNDKPSNRAMIDTGKFLS